MAKAETLGRHAGRGDGTGSTYKDYTSLLGVVAAGFLGISLLCITSAIALSAPNAPTPIALEPASIVDLAVNNINTVAALTVQALSVDNESTPFLLPSKTPTATASASPTTTLVVIPTFPQREPTKTRAPRIPSTATPKPPPTKTAIPPTKTPTSVPPTNTFVPTNTAIPNTPTPIPPPSDTNTPIPPPSDTNTPIPPLTNTPIPPPTNTPIPPPTNTPIPPPSNTPMSNNPIADNTSTPTP